MLAVCGRFEALLLSWVHVGNEGEGKARVDGVGCGL